MRGMVPCPPPGGAVRPGSPVVVSEASGSVPGMSHDLAAWTLVVVAWILVIGACVLLLRTVCLERLDPEQDESDDQVSGHAPS
jgi:hypothetical protein